MIRLKLGLDITYVGMTYCRYEAHHNLVVRSPDREIDQTVQEDRNQNG